MPRNPSRIRARKSYERFSAFLEFLDQNPDRGAILYEVHNLIDAHRGYQSQVYSAYSRESIDQLLADRPSPVGGVRRYLDCSTAHIAPEEAELLSAGGSNIIPHRYGWWLRVHGFEPPVAEGGIDAVLDKAEELNCQWVYFDRDGTQHDDLEVYDW